MASFQAAPAPLLALTSQGISTALSVDVGHDGTRVMAIKEGKPVPGGTGSVELGGKDVSEGVILALAERGYAFPDESSRKVLRGMFKVPP